MDKATITAAWIEEQQALCAKATPGPWCLEVMDRGYEIGTHHEGRYGHPYDGGLPEIDRHDGALLFEVLKHHRTPLDTGEFVVAACTALPLALAALKDAREALSELRAGAPVLTPHEEAALDRLSRALGLDDGEG